MRCSRLRLVGFVLIVKLVAVSQLAVAGDEVARITAPKEVKGHTCRVQVEVDAVLLRAVDVWIGVIPEKAPDKCWLQGARLFGKKQSRSVYVGERPRIFEAEEFQIVVLSVPKGVIKTDGPVKTADFEMLKIEIVAETVTTRTE